MLENTRPQFNLAAKLSKRSSMPMHQAIQAGGVSNNYKNVNFIQIPEIYKINQIASAVSEAELMSGTAL